MAPNCLTPGSPVVRLALAVGAVGLGGCGLFVQPDEIRLGLMALKAPATIASGAPVPVSIEYGIGGCESLRRIVQRREGGLLLIEVRATRSDGGGYANCPDILLVRDTTVTFALLPDGTYEVRGLQPNGGPLVAAVHVGP